MSAAPALEGSKSSRGFELAAGGSWTTAHADQLQMLIEAIPLADIESNNITIDLSRIRELDTLGTWLLESAIRRARGAGKTANLNGIPERYRDLVDALRQVNRHQPISTKSPALAPAFLDKAGQAIVAIGNSAVAFIEMLGAVSLSIFRIILHPAKFRLTSTVYYFHRVGWQAVPIVSMITFLIGCIIAQQGFFHFRKFGAETYVVDMVGILILREIGVLLVATMVAGRSGSAYTAELGAMKMREEIDALRTMGFDPVDILIVPRVIALICALPVLTFLGSVAALYGGALVAWFYGGMSPAIFIDRLKEAISITHFEVGMIKAPFMALVIGIVASSEGLRVKGSAESLGTQTTASVVKSIFLVIVLDGVFAIFFAAIGM
jgi:phospholipid/cholesterol/gamma-HCH transport system permease protein